MNHSKRVVGQVKQTNKQTIGIMWRRKTCIIPPVKYFSDRSNFFTSFVDHLVYLCLVFVMLLRLFIATLWSSAVKRADLLAHVYDV